MLYFFLFLCIILFTFCYITLLHALNVQSKFLLVPNLCFFCAFTFSLAHKASNTYRQGIACYDKSPESSLVWKAFSRAWRFQNKNAMRGQLCADRYLWNIHTITALYLSFKDHLVLGHWVHRMNLLLCWAFLFQCFLQTELLYEV